MLAWSIGEGSDPKGRGRPPRGTGVSTHPFPPSFRQPEGPSGVRGPSLTTRPIPRLARADRGMRPCTLTYIATAADRTPGSPRVRSGLDGSR